MPDLPLFAIPDVTHDAYSGQPLVRIMQGARIKTWGGWYEHAQVEVGGKMLSGFVQYKKIPRHRHLDVTTHFENMAVRGLNVEWLQRMNQEKENAHA